MDKLNFPITFKVLVLTAIVSLSLGALTCQAGFTDRTSLFDVSLEGTMKVAWGDFNNDGWVDLYIPEKLSATFWRNDGKTGGTHNGFTAVTVSGGLGVLGDYNNDGYLDIFCYDSVMELFRNSGGTSFAGDSMPTLPTTDSFSASWADHDGDGDLDLYIGGYERWDPPVTYPDIILENNDGAFSIKWQQTVCRARGVTSCDFDEDGDIDIYVSNYRLQPNLLWLNDGNGTFTNVAAAYGVAGDPGGSYPYGHTIGSAWGDLDNDGHIDLFVGNFRHNWGDGSQDHAKFLRNRGPGSGYTFQLMDELDGSDWQESYATPALGDYDNDGDLDLYFTTVYGGGSDSPALFRNDGAWTFTDVTASEGLGSLGSTYQAAWGDYDNDGDLDLVTKEKLFRNDLSNSNHWLKVHLKAPTNPNINAAAIGAQARILLDTGKTVTRQVEGGTGEGNQNELTLHFGLGAQTAPVDIVVTWPNGTTQTEEDVSVDQLITITAMEYKKSDIYKDGYVNEKDLAKLLKDWLKCDDPENEDCGTGPP